MTRIDQFISFCKVVDLGSFSQAGEALGISQPTISLQIKALEEEYGAKLLHRDGHKILPNEFGQIVYEHFVKIISLYKESKENVSKKRGEYSGTLRMGAFAGLADSLIPIILLQFQEEHPTSEIILHTGDSNEIIDKTANQSLDISFVGTKRREGDLVFTPYLEDPLILVTASNSPYANKEIITYREFQSIPIIIQQSGSSATLTLKTALSKIQLHLSDLNIIMQMGLNGTVKNAVLSGYGATIISSLNIKNEIESGQLKKITIENLDLQRMIYICHNREVPLSNLAKKFIDFAMKKK